jgi:hypothetical protein
MFHLFQSYVAIVSHLSVAKADLNVGLFSEKEIASGESHGGVGCKLAVALHQRMHKRPRWSMQSIPVRHAASALALPEVPEHKLVASPCVTDRDAEPGCGGDASLRWLRPSAGVASGQAPCYPGAADALLRGGPDRVQRSCVHMRA